MDLPAQNGEGYAARYEEALGAERGGYVVKKADDADVVLIANGSEVSTLFAADEILAAKGIKTQIVSVPSIGLFLNQSKDYRNSVIPEGVRRFGLTAGLPSTLLKLIPEGTIFGLDHFGFSAPYGVLDEKFGFTAQNVAEQIEDLVRG